MSHTLPFRPLLLAGAAAAALAILSIPAAAQTSGSPLAGPPNGPREVDPGRHALVGATVHASPDRAIEDAMVLIQDGRVIRVGQAGEPPAGFRVWDCSGLHIYPGFIDAFVEVDAPRADGDAPGAHWNAAVTPQRTALDGGGIPESAAGSLRNLGFTAAGISPRTGVFRGTGSVVSLAEAPGDRSVDQPPVYARDVFHAVGFDRRAWGVGYPSAQIGAIAVIRQTLADAQWLNWRKEYGEKDPPNCLETLFDSSRPLVFDVRTELEVLRAARIAKEFERPAIIVGSGREYRRLDAVREDGFPLIVPMRYTSAPDVSSVGAVDAATLDELMGWEQDPTNLRRLDAAGVTVAITSGQIPRGQNFYENLRKAIDHGLPEDRALAMLTTVPARLLGVDDRLGTVEPDRIANLVIADGPIFAQGTKIRDVWVDGRRHEINAAPDPDLAGEWAFAFPDDPDRTGTIVVGPGNRVTVHAEPAEPEGEAQEFRARGVSIRGDQISYLGDLPGLDQTVIVSATASGDRMHGHLITPDQRMFHFTATRAPRDTANADESAGRPARQRRPAEVPEALGYPFGPYMVTETPEPLNVMFRNATIWTSGSNGIIENGALWIRDGVIQYVGPDDTIPEIAVPYIDMTGKHLTPGLIDCHSHTGTWGGGVNEGGLAVTAQTRMGDTTDPDTVSWYRQLAGGVTAVNTLHGSANPIGGQNVVHKVRWGVPRPEDMHMEGAVPGIKFALGENVKRSRSSSNSRYPDTRMGVEVVIRDSFTAARDYARAWRQWESTDGNQPPPRRDLTLEALAQILDGNRLVHCHSYRQDEILMLCRIAADFGFRIGTFQHVLEGYKVAEAIREHAIGASAFSDWWAYKVEVQDAIPYAGAIMHAAGVNVSFNSDSDELARRMNIEAAKAVAYGGVEPAEALKFITINPAIQLQIHDRVGSLEQGKDADFAVWSGDPLSTLSRCEATYIDGREYFSLDRDAEHRRWIAAERARLVQKVLAEGRRQPPSREGAEEPDEDRPTRRRGRPMVDSPDTPPDDAAAAALRAYYMDLHLRGIDPTTHMCGDCGVTKLDILDTARSNR